MDQLPRLGKRELICLLLFTCNNVVSVWRGFLFLWVLGMGKVILLWHSLSLPYNYFYVNVQHVLQVFVSYTNCVWPDMRLVFNKKLYNVLFNNETMFCLQHHRHHGNISVQK